MRQYLKFAINYLKPSRVISDKFGNKYRDSRIYALERHVSESGVFDEFSIIQEFIKGFDIRKETALDIGANVGLVSIPLSNDFNQVFSFEPDPFNIKRFIENVSLNDELGISLQEMAVGSSSCNLDLSINRVIDGDGLINNGLSSLSKRNRLYKKKLVTVEVTTVDEFCESRNLEQIDFIKIDTEGYELEVLSGAEKTIKQSTPSIFYEFSKTLDQRLGSHQSMKCYDLLSDFGYKHYIINGENKVECISRDFASQLADDINVFAVHENRSQV